MQGPEPYLKAIGVTLTCPVRRDLDAVLDETHRTRVGHELYYFSSPEAMAEFEARPLRYVDLLTDPVSMESFEPTERSPRFEYQGRPYYFSTEETLAAFRINPRHYADPMRAMR